MVIARTVDAVQEQIIAKYSPMLDLLSQGTVNFDDWMASRIVNRWRQQVWEHAIAHLRAHNRDEKFRIRQEVEYIALRRADVILLKQGPFKMSALK